MPKTPKLTPQKRSLEQEPSSPKRESPPAPPPPQKKTGVNPDQVQLNKRHRKATRTPAWTYSPPKVNFLVKHEKAIFNLSLIGLMVIATLLLVGLGYRYFPDGTSCSMEAIRTSNFTPEAIQLLISTLPACFR